MNFFQNCVFFVLKSKSQSITMSAKIAKSATVVLTDKFKKELEKFFEWAVMSEYIIKDINNEQQEWSMKLLNKFEEPGRNKLEAYIKALFAKYTISIGEMDIEDAKLLAKEFKEKPKKSEKEKPKKSEKAKTTKKLPTEDVTVPWGYEDTSILDAESIKLDMSLDTSETFNVDTLEFWTSELVQVFGKPKKTGGKDHEHTWEWKVEVNGQPFTIYDWNENGDSFEEATWYLGSTSENKKNIKALNSYIESWFVEETPVVKEVKPKTKKEVKPKEVEEIVEEKKVSMEDLFGDDSDMDNDEVELNLEDIEDDE